MDEQALQQTINKLNEMMSGFSRYKIDIVNPKDLVTTKKNARYMDDKEFKSLVSNIKKDRNLSSVPLCYKDKDVYHLLSGNHRVEASIAAGVEKIIILYDDNIKSKSTKTAIQLSHNAIVGKDDLNILKELYDSIKDVDLKEYAGLDDELIKKLESIEYEVLKEPNIKYEAVTFLFLPGEVKSLENWLAEISLLFKDEKVYVGKLQDFNTFLSAVRESKKLNNIKNNSLALLKAIEDIVIVYRQRIKENGKGEKKESR